MLLTLGCAPKQRNLINASFQDMTARYNAYFIANEHIKKIEATLHNGHTWSYDKVLPIYATFDSTDVASLADQLEDCIQKSSIAIQRHPGSKWEYPSYILVGKARFYGLEFADAVEAFKYVNTKSKNQNVRHEALINLIRTFVIKKEFNNAIAVADHLKKESLNRKNKQYFHLNQAYLYQERGDLDLMVQHLVNAEAIFTPARDKARIQFIIGQVYQQLDFPAAAFSYYKKSLKNRPSYELAFFTKLNMAQVTQFAEDKDIKTVKKYFKKLLNDRKNLEYNDRIYYEMGIFEQEQGNIDEAIANYKQSIKVSEENNRQKGLSYLRLANIHYDSLKNFELAKNYYDSTVAALPKSEENYGAIKTRQEVLEEFVKYITTIRINDSLVSLSKLPLDSIRALAVTQVTQDSLQQVRAAKKKAQLLQAHQQRQKKSRDKEGSLINTESQGTWYFDNTSAVSRGWSSFRQKWKDRPLEDNWRRSVKSAPVSITGTTGGSSEELPVQSEKRPSRTKEPEVPIETFDNQVQSLIGNIPTTDQQRQKLLDAVKDALYEVGNIYNFKLKEKPNAIATFLHFLRRFPSSEYEPEVLYQLYLLQKITNPERSKKASTQLLNEYPESVYSKFIVNPNYREENFATTVQLQKVYKESYDLYDKGEYQMSKKLLDSALSTYPKNEFSDYLQLLKILTIGQLENQHRYQFELDNFVKSYADSELLPYVETLIKTSNNFKVNLYSSSKAKYIESFDQKHYFALIYQSTESNNTIATDLVQTYIEENNLLAFKSGSLSLTDEYSIAIINNIENKHRANEIFASFNRQITPSASFKSDKYFVFIITDDNFDILYKTKDIDTYQTFFDKHYP